jgi:hypothetical protein
VSRVIVGGLFALFMLSTVLKAIEEGGRALADPSLRNWLVLGFWVLKIAVVGAFWWFIVARPWPSRRARRPSWVPSPSRAPHSRRRRRCSWPGRRLPS